VIRIILPFLVYTGLTATAAFAAKRPFGKVLPVTMCMSGLVMYLSQYIFSSFSPGAYLLALLSLLSVLFLAYRGRKGERAGAPVLTPGLAAFAVIYLGAFLFLYKRHFTDWDEYSHWGIMIKESLRLDRFYCVPESRVMWHRDYPPFTCMLEVFWCRLAGYSEGKVSMAMQVFTLSFIIPPLSETLYEGKRPGRRNIAEMILGAAVLELLVLLLVLYADLWWQRIIHSILPDLLLGTMFAYLCLKILLRDDCRWQDTAALTAVSASLVLVKQVGAAFLMTALLLLYLKDILWSAKKQVPLRKLLPEALAVPAAAVLFYGSWILYRSRFINSRDFSYRSGQFNLKQIDPRTYLGVVTGKVPGIQHDTFIQYLRAILERPITSVDALPMTYASMLILCIAVLLAYRRFFRDEQTKEASLLLIPVFCVGTTGYAFMMSVLYLFCFPDNEKQILAGYTRYMDSYAAGELLILFVLGMTALHKQKKRKTDTEKLVITALFLMALSAQNLRHFVPALMNSSYSLYREYADRLEVLPPDSEVFIVYDGDPEKQPDYWEHLPLFVQYYNNKVGISGASETAFNADYVDESRKNRIADEMKHCDYVYVIQAGESFVCEMKDYNSGMELKENCIYRVDGDAGLKLTPVE